jgi:signal transduction histidine kinase
MEKGAGMKIKLDWLKPDKSIEDLRENFEAGVQTQEEVQQTRARLVTLFDAVSDSVFVFQKAEILIMNEAARQLVENAAELREAFLSSIYEKGLKTFYGLPEQFTFPLKDQEEGVFIIRSCVKLNVEGGESYLITVLDLTEATRLSQQIEYLSLNERKRISRDLHDGLSQLLSSLSLQTKALSLKYKDHPDAERLQILSDRAARCVALGTEVYRNLDEI